jgi:hypothetical protein
LNVIVVVEPAPERNAIGPLEILLADREIENPA